MCYRSRKDLVKVTSIAQPKVIDCLKTLSKSKCVTAKKVTVGYLKGCSRDDNLFNIVYRANMIPSV
jgi:hypothetical protein